MPEPALLKSQPEPQCAYSATHPDEGEPQPVVAATAPDPDGVVRTRLDYERQCFRHAEMIARERLQKLQASVQETLKSLNRDSRQVR